jgi:hypothetical protein
MMRCLFPTKVINIVSNEFTSLESFGGVSSIALKVKSLIEFIKSNTGIKKYKNKNKAVPLFQLIVQRKKFTKEYCINTNTPLVAQPAPTTADMASTKMNTNWKPKKTYLDALALLLHLNHHRHLLPGHQHSSSSVKNTTMQMYLR